MTYSHNELHSIYSDLYKDAHGFRPRNDVSSWTEEDFLNEFSYLETVIAQNVHDEQEAQKQAIIRFEGVVSKTIEYGAKDRISALKWLFESDDLNFESVFDQEYVEYANGLPYGYFKKVA